MNKIKDLRDARGWSMQRLADACSPPTTASQINKLEKGRIRLTVEWMQRLADALECHPADLLDGGPAALTPGERELLDHYRALTERGQDKLRGYAAGIRDAGGGAGKGSGTDPPSPPPPLAPGGAPITPVGAADSSAPRRARRRAGGNRR